MKKLSVLALGIIISFSSFSFDGLGNKSTATSQTDAKVALKSSNNLNASTTNIAKFSTNIIQDNGTIIKEFIRTDGVIFGVSWQGQIVPDLSALLGNYSQLLSQTKNPDTVNHRTYNKQIDNFIIHKTSIGRLNAGFAFLQDLLPDNFDTNSFTQ
jgi:hypothetical protein